MTERSFAAALKFHMDRGTRPSPGLRGRPWTVAELATVVGCSDKIVSIWLNGGIPSRKNVFEVELALFGDVPAEDPGEIGRWRTEFRAAADRQRTLRSRAPGEEAAAAEAASPASGEPPLPAAAPFEPPMAPRASASMFARVTRARGPARLIVGALAVLVVAIAIGVALMTGEPGTLVANAGPEVVATPDLSSCPPGTYVAGITGDKLYRDVVTGMLAGLRTLCSNSVTAIPQEARGDAARLPIGFAQCPSGMAIVGIQGIQAIDMYRPRELATGQPSELAQLRVLCSDRTVAATTPEVIGEEPWNVFVPAAPTFRRCPPGTIMAGVTETVQARNGRNYVIDVAPACSDRTFDATPIEG